MLELDANSGKNAEIIEFIDYFIDFQNFKIFLNKFNKKKLNAF